RRCTRSHRRRSRRPGPDQEDWSVSPPEPIPGGRGSWSADYSGPAMPVDEAIDALIDVVPALRGERVVSELAGGLTNTNYKVETPGGDCTARAGSATTSTCSPSSAGT